MGHLKKTYIEDWTGQIVGMACPEKFIEIRVCEKSQACRNERYKIKGFLWRYKS